VLSGGETLRVPLEGAVVEGRGKAGAVPVVEEGAGLDAPALGSVEAARDVVVVVFFVVWGVVFFAGRAAFVVAFAGVVVAFAGVAAAVAGVVVVLTVVVGAGSGAGAGSGLGVVGRAVSVGVTSVGVGSVVVGGGSVGAGAVSVGVVSPDVAAERPGRARASETAATTHPHRAGRDLPLPPRLANVTTPPLPG